MFVRTESFAAFRRVYPIVTVIVAIHLILYIWMNFLPFGRDIYGFGVGYNAAVAAGEFWRLLTPVFLHIGFGHMLFNSFSLVIFGPALEQMLGRFKFLCAYILTGIGANIATFFLGGLQYNPHLGASGAIFGLLGIYIYLVVFRKDLIDRTNAQLVLTIVVIGFVMTYMNTNINTFAHLFGFIAGIAIAPLVLSGAQPFSRIHVYRQQSNGVAFDPQRWQKKKRSKKIVWGIIIALVIIGVLSNFY